MTEHELKQKFAKLLAGSDRTPFDVACELFPNNTARAARVAIEWGRDGEVRQMIDAHAVNKHDKETIRAEQVDILRSISKNPTIDPDVRIKAAKAIGELKGLIEKPVTNINNDVKTITNKVMVVRESDSDDAWREKVINQQRQLTDRSH